MTVRQILTSVDTLTVPFRLVLPTLMAVFLYVYDHDRKEDFKRIEESKAQFVVQVAEIKSSIDKGNKEQRDLLGNFQEWRNGVNIKIATLDATCCRNDRSRRLGP